ncbi:hypothetical protein [Paenibacillus sp. P22]|uniref:hypothetical protein n=1 Tax=Paenibacillus sp. P22 TaxID=483908 RepID=UPI00038F736A|nr:hypothetical protein [Paenibacillus sp. P22]CDN44858.1 hypothetical protein BN871_FT_00100 [Paenibacillus sp. P22]
MKKTIRLRYSRANREATGLMISCCGKHHLVVDLYGDAGAAYSCGECGRPLVCMGMNGRLYHVGDPVINEGREGFGDEQQA